MLPGPPKSSETRAIMLLSSRIFEHLQVWPEMVGAFSDLRGNGKRAVVENPLFG
jgi:hypothetical protein